MHLKPNLSNDAVFDASALNRALDASETMAQLVARVARDRVRVIVPGVCLEESFSTEDVRHVGRRGKALRDLRSRGIELRFAPIGRELRRPEDGRQLFRTPVWTRQLERRLLARLSGSSSTPYSETHARLREQVEKEKARMLAKDATARVELYERQEVQGLNDKRLIAALRNSAIDWFPHLDWLILSATERYARRSWSQITRHASRYKMAIAWAGCSWLTMWGVALPPNSGYPEAQRLRLARGNWYDNEVAASAGYAKYLITNDEGLAFKCKRLAERGLITFRTLSLPEFLG